MYRHIYPDWKVNLDQLAYYFDYSLEDSQENPENYMAPFRSAVKSWADAHNYKEVFFRYRKGPGFIELQDNRPMGAEKAVPVRRKMLMGVESEVYLLCDSIKSFREINDFVKKKTSPAWSDEQVRAMLTRMVEDKYMFVEKDRYLALATASPLN